jgi:4-hydroxybenzoate polyprenyltransferase
MVVGDPYLITLFTTGAFIMRGAGCTINDMWDAKYDQQVTRTQHRPLASGIIPIFPHATLFLGAQLLSGLTVLSSFPTQHLPFCFMVGMSSMPLVVLYPLMKRYTHWPQLVLGLTFNWGTWMGWAAVHGSFTESTSLLGQVQGISVLVPLYAGCVAWTLVYDTLYAHQDKEDDRTLGLKSTALYFGDDHGKQRRILSSFAILAGSCWMVSGYQVGIDVELMMEHPVCGLYYVGCLGAMGHLLWQVHTAKFDDVKNLSHRFKSNSVVGTIMLGSCIVGNMGLLL